MSEVLLQWREVTVLPLDPRGRECPLYSRDRTSLQGYLAREKQRLPRTLQWDYAQGPLVDLWGGAVSYERGTSVGEDE